MIGFKKILHGDRLLGDDNRVYKLTDNELRATEYQFPIIKYHVGYQVGYKDGICYIPTDDGYNEVQSEISPKFSMIDDDICMIADEHSVYKLVDDEFEKIHEFEERIISTDICGTEYAILFKDVIIWYTDYGTNTLLQEDIIEIELTSDSVYVVDDNEKLFEWRRDGSVNKIIEGCVDVSSLNDYICYCTNNETHILNINTNESTIAPYYTNYFKCDDYGITLIEMNDRLYINDRLITENDGQMKHGTFKEYYHDESRIILLFDRIVKIWENGAIIDILNPYDVIECLENMISYAPGGDGYERTKNHFKELVK